jgi:hypothetical protein
MMKIEGSGSASGSGSTPKYHGSATLGCNLLGRKKIKESTLSIRTGGSWGQDQSPLSNPAERKNISTERIRKHTLV